MELEVKNNLTAQRFETKIEGQTAFVNYKLRKVIMTVLHTEVPEAIKGRGIATALSKYVLDYIAEENLEIIPLCPFMHSYLKTHPEYEYLVKKKEAN